MKSPDRPKGTGLGYGLQPGHGPNPQAIANSVATRRAMKDTRQTAFLRAFAKVGNISSAATDTGIRSRTVRDWLNQDSEFATLFEEAKEEFADYLEKLALQKIETMKQGHDLLHITLLNANRPAKYRREQATSRGEITITQIIINPPQSSSAENATITTHAYQVLESTHQPQLADSPEAG